VLEAPVMSAQLAPAESQRRHWYEYAIGVEPLQLPGAAVSPDPTSVVPLIDGADVFAGADPLGGVGSPPPPPSAGRGATTSVSNDALEPLPNLFVAVTTTRSRYVTSADVRVYVFVVAFATFVQLVSDEQRRHWYANWSCAPEPDHVPSLAVRLNPSCAAPAIVGGDCGSGAFFGFPAALAP
jgi:hypothetical protein